MSNEELINKTILGSRKLILTKENKIIYVYKTTCLINGKIYVGVRKYKGINPLEDTYIGCGIYRRKNGKVIFMYENITSPFFMAVKEFGYDNFKKEILLYFDSIEKALLAEKFIVDDYFISLDTTYNKIIGGGLPPIGNGEKNNNWGHKWTNEMKESLSKYKKELKIHVGNKNPRAVKCDLYDFFKDERYNLNYIRESYNIVGFKLDYNWKGLMNYRYILLLPNEDPYERLNKLGKSLNTIKILQFIKDGYSKENCKKISGLNSNFINRVYKNILKNES
jgi:hypothetical protein